MKHTPAACSCKIVHTKFRDHSMSQYPDRIVYCPLHEAAPKLLEAAKHAMRVFPEQMRGSVLEVAIAKAEGTP